jgi:hypothetical protein
MAIFGAIQEKDYFCIVNEKFSWASPDYSHAQHSKQVCSVFA